MTFIGISILILNNERGLLRQGHHLLHVGQKSIKKCGGDLELFTGSFFLPANKQDV